MKKNSKSIRKLLQSTGLCILLCAAFLLFGCGKKENVEGADNHQGNLSENVVITETGEVIDREALDTEASAATPSPEKMGAEAERVEGYTPIEPQVDFVIPEPEETDEEDETEESSSGELQLVFLGDSIFDNNRDGTGVPYLTAEKCNAGLYNLAIGGTSATIEWDESQESANWTSKSLCGIVRAMKKEIPTDCFEGTRAKRILDDPEVDFSKTDYFIVEYGMNDYFRAVPLSLGESNYDMRCYSGALRYAVSNLGDVASDATIILCAPNYAQFYNREGYLVGEGNMTNTGYGTLFDYKGTCNYIAKEQQTLFFNAYQDLGIDGYTAEEYLEDGVHLTEAGRELYADALAEMILDYEETKNN